MTNDTTCALCGHRFSEAECVATCSRCALFGSGGCHKVRCPRCGYEMPAPARLPALIARLVKKVTGLAGDKTMKGQGDNKPTDTDAYR